ncbi:MAG: cyclic nucleotide-binding domain-containing protein [Alphaproteobacteria bacterium]
MSLNQEVDLLRSIPLFQNMEPSKLKLLAFTAERLTFEPGQMLFRQGDPGDALYIVVEGEAEVFIDSADGELHLAEIGRNAPVGEMAIVGDVPRSASVRATSALVTLKISKELFFRLVNEFPQIAVEIMRVLATRLEHTNTQLRAAEAELRRLQADGP